MMKKLKTTSSKSFSYKDPTEPIDEEDPSARAFEVFQSSQRDETKDDGSPRDGTLEEDDQA